MGNEVIASVIIPTEGRPERLQLCLRALAAQSGCVWSEIEVLVIDDSVNGLNMDLLQAKSYPYCLKICRFPFRGLHFSRNGGALQAQGELLLYLDDDAFPRPAWLSSIVVAFQDSKIGLVGGSCLPKFEPEPPVWFEGLWALNRHGHEYIAEYSLYKGGDERQEIDPQFVFGCNFAIRRKLLMNIGGFHPDGFPKDRWMLRGDGETYVAESVGRYDYLVCYIPGAIVDHCVGSNRLNYGYLWRRARSGAVSSMYVNFRKNAVSCISLTNLALFMVVYRMFSFLFIYVFCEKPRVLMAWSKWGYSYGAFRYGAEFMMSKELRRWVAKRDYFDI